MSKLTLRFTLRVFALLLIIGCCGTACSGTATRSAARLPADTPARPPADTPVRLSTDTPATAPSNMPARPPTNTPERPPTSAPARPPTNTPERLPVNPPRVPSININPNSGPIGTVHSIELVDFTPNSLVNISVYHVDTGKLVLNFRLEVDYTGYGLTGMYNEPGDETGGYRVVAYDQATGLAAEGTFFTEQALPPRNPSITISPGSGPIGTVHTIELVDFTPNSLIDINSYYTATGERTLKFQVETNEIGYRLTGIYSEPGDDVGEYRVVAYDQATGLVAEGTFFTEQAPPVINPSISVSPRSGPIGTLHTIELVDFTPYSLLDISSYYAATGELVLKFQVGVNSIGYRLAGIYSEAGDDIGEYRVVAYDPATGLSAESTLVTEQAVDILYAQIRLDPTTIDFTPGEDTGTRPLLDFVWIGDDDLNDVILQNTGGAPIVIASYEFTSPNPEDFYILDQIIGAKLNPGQSCRIYVVFEPLNIGERWTNLIIRSNQTQAGTATSEVAVHGFARVNTLGLAMTTSPLTSPSIPDCHELVY